jgi:hypothetical protein
MLATVVLRQDDDILNHCARYLARDNVDGRHDYFGVDAGQPNAAIAEAWRFPVIQAHDAATADAANFNDVTFVLAAPLNQPPPVDVRVVASCLGLNRPEPMRRLGDHVYWAVTLKVPRGGCFRYLFLVDGVVQLDAVNPQSLVLSTGDRWSQFFTWACTDLVSLERWEFQLIDRLSRHILPFNNREARNLLARLGLEARTASHLHRLDIAVGAANYIDKIIAREERHHRYAYKTCLALLATILARRNPGRGIEQLPEAEFTRLYDEMADASRWSALTADGWVLPRYDNPAYFLWLLRRHVWTGAFAHPNWGGNPGGMAWAYLAEAYRTTAPPGLTAFDWRQAIELPLGTNAEYLA